MKIDNEDISLIKWAIIYIGIFSLLHYLTLPYTTEKSREVIILNKLPYKGSRGYSGYEIIVKVVENGKVIDLGCSVEQYSRFKVGQSLVTPLSDQRIDLNLPFWFFPLLIIKLLLFIFGCLILGLFMIFAFTALFSKK